LRPRSSLTRRRRPHPRGLGDTEQPVVGPRESLKVRPVTSWSSPARPGWPSTPRATRLVRARGLDLRRQGSALQAFASRIAKPASWYWQSPTPSRARSSSSHFWPVVVGSEQTPDGAGWTAAWWTADEVPGVRPGRRGIRLRPDTQARYPGRVPDLHCHVGGRRHGGRPDVARPAELQPALSPPS
jgi:hypothetical protein